MSKAIGQRIGAALGTVIILAGIPGYAGEVQAASPSAQHVIAQASANGLPADFPIPDDAIVVTAMQNEGLQSPFVRITYHTRLSMELLAKTYSEYFRGQDMSNALRQISEQRLVIQGTDPVTYQNWILTGNQLPQNNGWVEITLIWND